MKKYIKKMKQLSFRTWLSIMTFVLIALILFLSRHELLQAWHLLQQVNIWVLIAVFPVAALGYLAAGEMIFSYLRQKGFVRDVSPFALMRLSLELNFVNHAFPSGGLSGISYANWRLRKYGVSTGRATMAQMVRYVMGFVAVVLFLAVAVVIVTIDSGVNRWIILMSGGLVFCLTMITLLGVYLLTSQRRLHKAAHQITLTINGFARRILRRTKPVMDEAAVRRYCDDLHTDFLELRRDKKLLWQPFVWSIIFTIMEILPFWMTFQSLGVSVNPASILIAYGVATTMAVVVATPGGAGAYEAVMVGILALSGVSQGQAIAGTMLYRVIAIVTTLVFGYAFYQLTIMRYGRDKPPTTER